MTTLLKSTLKGGSTSTSRRPSVSEDSHASSFTSQATPSAGWPAPLHPDADKQGGLSVNDEVLLKEQREAVTEWVKSMGRQLFTGSFNLVSVPFPVKTFEPRSFLEKMSDVWVYQSYLTEASATSDPVYRMQLVMTWFVAGLHRIFGKWRKPFNPIVGETWQAKLSDGTQVNMEQISHHPPVSAFLMEGPDKSFKFCGVSQPNVALVLKHYGFKSHAKGYRYMEFRDGSRIDMEFPGYYVKNVVYSSKPRAEMDGEATFVDEKNLLQGVIHFGATPNLKRTDAVWGGIYKVEPTATSGHHRAFSTVLEHEDELAEVAPRASLRRNYDETDELEEYYESASETADWDTRAEEPDVLSAAAATAAAAAPSSSSSPPSTSSTTEAGLLFGPHGVFGGAAGARAAQLAAASNTRSVTAGGGGGGDGASAQREKERSQAFGLGAVGAGSEGGASLQSQAEHSSSSGSKPRKSSGLSSLKKHLRVSSSSSRKHKGPPLREDSTGSADGLLRSRARSAHRTTSPLAGHGSDPDLQKLESKHAHSSNPMVACLPLLQHYSLPHQSHGSRSKGRHARSSKDAQHSVQTHEQHAGKEWLGVGTGESQQVQNSGSSGHAGEQVQGSGGSRSGRHEGIQQQHQHHHQLLQQQQQQQQQKETQKEQQQKEQKHHGGLSLRFRRLSRHKSKAEDEGGSPHTHTGAGSAQHSPMHTQPGSSTQRTSSQQQAGLQRQTSSIDTPRSQPLSPLAPMSPNYHTAPDFATVIPPTTTAASAPASPPPSAAAAAAAAGGTSAPSSATAATAAAAAAGQGRPLGKAVSFAPPRPVVGQRAVNGSQTQPQSPTAEGITLHRGLSSLAGKRSESRQSELLEAAGSHPLPEQSELPKANTLTTPLTEESLEASNASRKSKQTGVQGGESGRLSSASSTKLEAKASSGGMLSGFSKMMGLGAAAPVTRQDEEVQPGRLLVPMEGSWLSHLDAGGKRMWTLATDVSDTWVAEENPLPSDSRFRSDLIALAQGDLKEAQVQKELLERRQRHEKKMREQQA